MFKVIGFICFVLAGAIGGTSLSDKLKYMSESSREIHSMLTQILIMIRFRGLNVFEIFHELHQTDAYPHLNFINNLPENYECGVDFYDIWSDAVLNDKKLGKDEQDLLLSFGAMLGRSDIEGQVMSIESAIENVKILELRRSDEYQRKGKLYRSVGMLFGTMAGIMII